ncbi:blue copper protein-like [Cynara cardunculus var. scolymus]|uniref:blue copper protein-like n=1 Tax=Cynara cardunculus var. scolymus TaxID=59895 RepID=UPI000D62E771|nr:blue copper protein-like [Cynara cardunculus var. scolymus]
MATYDIGMMGFMVILSCFTCGLAKVYIVGDTAGWALSVDYTTWTGDKTFKVGDSLVFNYDSSHTVDEVSSGDYTTCSVGNSIASYNSGTSTIALNTTGNHYFICGVVGHCSGGMKLTVAVTGADGSPSAAPSSITADSPSTSTTLGNTLTPATTAAETRNIPAESSSSAISPFAAAIFSLVALLWELVLA